MNDNKHDDASYNDEELDRVVTETMVSFNAALFRAKERHKWDTIDLRFVHECLGGVILETLNHGYMCSIHHSDGVPLCKEFYDVYFKTLQDTLYEQLKLPLKNEASNEVH